MKKAFIILAFLAAMQLAAQDKATTITVKSTETNNGVIIVSIQSAEGQAKSFELHCNQGTAFCKAPEPGSYLMVRLPKNWGIYECANVDLFAASADPANDEKLGEFCIKAK